MLAKYQPASRLERLETRVRVPEALTEGTIYRDLFDIGSPATVSVSAS